MAIYYSPAAIAEVKLNLDWQLGANKGSIEDAVESGARTKWQDAAYELCEGQEHNPAAQVLYLRYFPLAIRCAAQMSKQEYVHIHDPKFQSGPTYDSADIQLVINSIDWQFHNNYKSLDNARDYASNGEWYEAAFYLCNGQRHNPEAMALYVRYFPVAMRYAASKLGVNVDIHDPELVDASGLTYEPVRLTAINFGS